MNQKFSALYLRYPLTGNVTKPIHIESSILEYNDFSIINSWIKPFKLRRKIFRASKHNFNNEKFHKVVDSFPTTLLIAQSTSGCIFGAFNPHGYKPQPIPQTSKPNQIQQQERAFLFAIGRGRSGNQKIDATQDLREYFGNFNKPNKGPTVGNALSLDLNSYRLQKTTHFISQNWLCSESSGTLIEYEIFQLVK